MMEGKKIGRPPLAAPARLFRLTLSLRPGEDDDLIAFFEELPAGSRARAVVTALRQGGVGERRGLQQEIDEAELTAMLEELLF
jgi:hypothetical protein